MPIIEKQHPVAAPRPTRNGRPPASDPWGASSYVKMLLYGDSGSGKTTFWATFPGPILALIRSGGRTPGELRSIDTPEYRAKITPRFVNTVDEYRAALAGANGFATVVLDHVTGFADMVLGEIIGKPVPEQKGWGLASQQQYGQLGMQSKELLRLLLDLPAHVVIVAHQRTNGGRDDGLDPGVMQPSVGAAVTPSLAGWLNGACDFVVQMFKRPRMEKKTIEIAGKPREDLVRGRGVEYCLRTEPHDVYVTKFRMPRGRQLPDAIVDPTFAKVQKLIGG